MAKVLLINGSPKENGNTFAALSEVAKTLNSEGVATEIISIGKQAVQGCIACGMCGGMPQRRRIGSFRPSEQVLHYHEYASGQFTVLEHGLWPDSRAGKAGRGRHADDAYAWTQHGVDD